MVATEIEAPPERVFDLARSVDLHVESAADTGERAVGGTTSGLLNLGDEVTWRGRHLGVWQNLTSEITLFSRPTHFRDSMRRGAFRRMDHDHFFEQTAAGTLMRDVIEFAAPFGWAGRIVDALVLQHHLRRFLIQRNEILKRVAEGSSWERFIGSS